MKVQAIKHQDVKGKQQNYIKISQGEDIVIINVGEKTYNSVKELEKKQPLQENEETKFDPDKEKKLLNEINKPKAQRGI